MPVPGSTLTGSSAGTGEQARSSMLEQCQDRVVSRRKPPCNGTVWKYLEQRVNRRLPTELDALTEKTAMGHEVIVLIVRVHDIRINDATSLAVAGLVHRIRTVGEHPTMRQSVTPLEIDRDICSPDLVSLRTNDVCNGSIDADGGASGCNDTQYCASCPNA